VRGPASHWHGPRSFGPVGEEGGGTSGKGNLVSNDLSLEVGPQRILDVTMQSPLVSRWMNQVGSQEPDHSSFNGLFPPPGQLIFQVTPLSGRQWVVVLQMSLPVILLDEALKYLSRNHVDGEWKTLHSPTYFPPAASPPAQGVVQLQPPCLYSGRATLDHEVSGDLVLQGSWLSSLGYQWEHPQGHAALLTSLCHSLGWLGAVCYAGLGL
jgi:hypothetical protein